MPVPPEYERASAQFYEFLEQARDLAMLQTTHQAYTMVEGVLIAFRARLDAKQAVEFASMLPPLLRAMFLTDWDPTSAPLPFADREALTREVQGLRADHNVSPYDSIVSVARALRKFVNPDTFARVLEHMPAGAAEFWKT